MRRVPTLLLRLLPALLVALLFAATPAAADWSHGDAAVATSDTVHGVQPLKAADHAIKRPRHSANLEEFVGLDDDAEQYLKSLAVLVRPIAKLTFASDPAAPGYRAARPSHRACAPFPTGPPHA